ncbi:MAG: PEP-CTERM sorting domain-containing protein [Armatimonadetes bacterium]|nr:PEP-CTERM sorting domain-containing protein [Armatimonadota bacterium]
MNLRGIGVGFVCVAAAAAFGQASDNFNRADGPLGANWSDQVGAFRVQSNQAHSDVNGSNQWTKWVGGGNMSYASAVASVDIFATGGLNYVALMTGVGGTDNLYIKVQGSGGSFTNFGLYHGFNNGGFSANTGFFALNSNFSSARITTWISNGGDRINLGIDTNFDNVYDQTYSGDGVLSIAPNFGTGFGIGTFGESVFDNWQVVPEPATLLALGAGLAAFIRRRK